jgi:hypothetical protein
MKTNYSASTFRTFWNKVGLIVLLVAIFGIKSTNASHMAGADLTYVYQGNNTYLVTFTLYRDCAGISVSTTEVLSISSYLCGITLPSVTMNQVPGPPGVISSSCTGTSICNGGTEPGIEVYTYTGLVTLPQGCPDWQFTASECCRNNAISTLQNGASESLYIEAYLNNTLVNNSSPTFSNFPIVFECIGQNNYYNHGVIDPEGDSLVYSFIPPRTASNTAVTYASGYSVGNPLSSSPAATIDPVTGDIFMHPTQQEVAVVAVLIQEYRNGELIGSVMRDIQFYSIVCSNTLPAATGINGTNNYFTSSCVGGQLCFDIISNDSDPNDTLTMTWNNGIPAASFTTTGSPFPTGHFCWSPTAADARPQPYTFTVTIQDNACPSRGVQTYSFQVTVSNMNLSVTSTPSVQCFGDHNGSATATATGNPPLSYVWTNLSNGIESYSSTISHLLAGMYTVDVSDLNGCVATQVVTITEPPALTVSATATNAGCGGQFGSATALAVGGTPNYSYVWSDNQTGQVASNLTTGPISVVVTDDNGCIASTSTSVVSSIPVTFAITTSPTTCTSNDGTVTVTPTGGSGQFSYFWNPAVSTGATASGLSDGTYTVLVIDDSTGCSETLTASVSLIPCPTNCGVIIPCGNGQKEHKVLLCHVPPGNPQAQMTICIDWSSVPAHLANHPGDCLGTCPNGNRVMEGSMMSGGAFILYPNPFKNNFKIDAHVEGDVTIVIYDIQGRAVEVYTGSADDAALGATLTEGVYSVSIVSEEHSETIRMVKMSD